MKHNSISSSSLLALSLLLTVAGAHAQSNTRANVPFAFKVGAKQMPAGTYSVESKIGSDIIMVHNLQTGASALAMSRRDSPAAKTNKLIFHRYGSQYFLSAILGGKGSQAVVIPTSSQEKELQIAQTRAKSANNVEIASK